MTTIATDGKTVAGDGMMTDRGTIVSRNRIKVFRLKSGSVVGFAGPSALQRPVVDWLNGERSAPHVCDEDGFNLLELTNDGRVFHYDWRLLAVEMSAPAAIGSGMDLALAAMDLGRSPVEAIRVAEQRDNCTGGDITVMAPIAMPVA